jgi:hypothetical protein
VDGISRTTGAVYTWAAIGSTRGAAGFEVVVMTGSSVRMLDALIFPRRVAPLDVVITLPMGNLTQTEGASSPRRSA